MKKYLLFFLLSLTLYLLHVYISGHGIFGDGNAYWIHAHAIFFRGDLEYAEIYQHLQNFAGSKYTFDRTFWSLAPTLTGKLPNPWFVGTSVLWLPFLLVAKLLFFFLPFSLDPFHLAWEIVAGIGGIVYALLGLWLVERTLQRFFPAPAVLTAVLTLFFSTNLFFYTALEPALSHSPIFFVTALFIYLFTAAKPSTLATWFSLGLLAGIAASIRPSGIVISILIIFKIFHSYFHHHRNKQENLNKKPTLPLKEYKYYPAIRAGVVSLLGFTLGVLPQLLVQSILFGSPLAVSYLTGYHGRPDFSLAFIPQALFSPHRGLLIWTPVLALAYLGVFRLFLSRLPGKTPASLEPLRPISLALAPPSGHPASVRQLAFPFALFLLLHLLFVGTWNGVLSAGFSNRFFIETYPILAFGLAAVFLSLKPKLAYLIFFLSLYWNLALLLQFFLDKSRLVDLQHLTYCNLLAGQLFLPVQTLLRFLSSVLTP